jgi:hypothetical protein
MKYVKALVRYLLLTPLALLLVFEEWGWEPLARGLARLARLRLWAWFERRILALPRWGALGVFGVPVLALLPLKLLALYLFGAGHSLLALGLLIGAKLLGTALAARLFQLTHPALMQFGWFAYVYPRWKTWKDGLIQWIQASKAWQWARSVRVQLTAWWRT